MLAKFLREFISVQIHVAPVFAPACIQETTPGELFMYWFRAQGVLPRKGVGAYGVAPACLCMRCVCVCVCMSVVDSQSWPLKKQASVAIPLACYRIGFGPPARNRKNIGFGLPRPSPRK